MEFFTVFTPQGLSSKGHNKESKLIIAFVTTETVLVQ